MKPGRSPEKIRFIDSDAADYRCIFFGQKKASDGNRRHVLTSETTKRKKVYAFWACLVNN